MAERKIRSIGIALSGGGYRAAGFHLGMLDMLGRLGLLDRVKAMSTVSGGTITGAYYALEQSRGKPAEEIIPTLARWLVANDVIDRALKEHPVSTRSATRRRNLITNASEVYDQLLGGAQFGALLDNSGHLEEVIFNATELQTGIDFRFQKTLSPNARIGNKNVYITKEVARQLRLADIVAASSDFPGGFEPLEFPADFVFPGPVPEMPKIPERLAIMDGGIYDNQGTEALLLERQERTELDAVIISDTDQRPRSAYYSMPKREGGWRGLGVGLLVYLIFALGAVTTGSAVHNVLTLIRSGQPLWEIAVDVLPSLVAGGFFLTLFWIWRKVKSAIAKSYPNLAGDLRTFLFSLRWGDLVEMVSMRVGTLVTLTASIFLKRIRQQGYDRLYEDEKLKPRLVPNFIYGMATKNAKELPPTPLQKELAERANQMPTTLWFDNEQQFRDVFAAGQNSVVHALLRWITRGDADADGEVTGKLKEMWKLLQEDPFRFVPAVKDAPKGAATPTALPQATAAAASAPAAVAQKTGST
ncbi:MAG TPA: patatin-like phospholipase family protein [Myxococcales bacterium]|nr:patatin-like phospholipase family protein [Myxococcales bacterium]